MKIKGFFRWLTILIVIAFLGISDDLCPAANAEDNTWNVQVGAGTGMSFTGESFTTLDVVVKTPENAPEWFAIGMPSEGLYRHRFTPGGNEVSYAMFKYDIGELSDNVFGSIFLEPQADYMGDDGIVPVDEIVALGVGYQNIGDHWGVPALNGITLTAHINNRDGYITGIDIEKRISDGWGVLVHGVLYFDPGFKNYKSNIEAGFFHNMRPDGSLRLELCYAQYGYEKSFGYFILKGNVDLIRF